MYAAIRQGKAKTGMAEELARRVKWRLPLSRRRNGVAWRAFL